MVEKNTNKILYATCNICGNESSYDKKALAGSRWVINGIRITLCCPCEDELLLKIAKGRGLNLSLESGEIVKCNTNDFICVPVYYSIQNRKKLFDTELMSEEFKIQLKKLK